CAAVFRTGRSRRTRSAAAGESRARIRFPTCTGAAARASVAAQMAGELVERRRAIRRKRPPTAGRWARRLAHARRMRSAADGVGMSILIRHVHLPPERDARTRALLQHEWLVTNGLGGYASNSLA